MDRRGKVRIDTHCIACGAPLHNVTPQTKYCSACRSVRVRNQKQAQRKGSHKTCRTVVDIAAVCKAAKAAGCSYGEWVAEMGL